MLSLDQSGLGVDYLRVSYAKGAWLYGHDKSRKVNEKSTNGVKHLK